MLRSRSIYRRPQSLSYRPSLTPRVLELQAPFLTMADARYVRSLCKHVRSLQACCRTSWSSPRSSQYSRPDVVVTHVLAVLDSYSNGLHPEHKAFGKESHCVYLAAS